MMNKRMVLKNLAVMALIFAVVLCFLNSLSDVNEGRKNEEKQQIEAAVKKAAVACYASEGVYPPDIEYIKNNYGILVDSDSFVVKYEFIGSNIMPDITVLDLYDENKE
ncbi:MAG: hypothetical protein IJF29_00285 [Firmicutes bacterium]|nr:hypothetical protein [Bacillota bacterium]